MFKNVLVSVSDKTGLVEFLRPLIKSGLRIVSTGGTAKHLRENGFTVIEVSEQTGFPEVMGGRVKTLHPKVHMGLLARKDFPEDFQILKENGIEAFDLVICNLYPFEQTVLQNKPFEDVVENIDIGGPTILRAAAKNFQRVTVICDPADYSQILQQLEQNQAQTLEDRKRLAGKVFAHVATYDSLIAQVLDPHWGNEFAVGGKKVIDLRYGENAEQAAGWYRMMGEANGLSSCEIIQGKPLSYNNVLDLDAAVGLVKEFNLPTVVAVKHNNPCGVALNSNAMLALKQAIQADPVSVFGGILAFNHKIDLDQAEFLNTVFLECVIAPDFSDEAFMTLAKKKNLRVLRWPKLSSAQKNLEIRSVLGGFLIQTPDRYGSTVSEWKYIGEKPSDEVMQDLIFAEKICASLKSNAISVVKGRQTLGLGMGQVNRVDAVTHALERMKAHHPGSQGVVLASDAFFPFPDSIEKVAAAGVRWVLQPGGSVKDEEVFAATRALNVNMIITGKRHFRH